MRIWLAAGAFVFDMLLFDMLSDFIIEPLPFMGLPLPEPAAVPVSMPPLAELSLAVPPRVVCTLTSGAGEASVTAMMAIVI